MRYLPLLLLLTMIGAAFGQSASEVHIYSANQIFTPLSSASNRANATVNQRRLLLDPQRTSEYLRSSPDILLTNFPITSQDEADVVLHRSRSVVDANTKFVVGGANDEQRVGGVEIVSFTGSITNEPGSKVYLNLINGTMIGSIHRADGSVYNIGPSLEASAADQEYMLVSTTAYMPDRSFTCMANEPIGRLPAPPPAMNAEVLAAKTLLEVRIAVETDTEFFTATGADVAKAQAYVLAMYQMMSAIYEEEIHVTLYIPWLKTWTDSPRDPYNAKGDGVKLADTVRQYWRDNYSDVQRDVAQVITSISYGGGGLGYFDALCGKNGDYGYSTCSVQAGHAYPTFAFTYDVYIIAHELGHCFNAPHSHSCYWGVPIDTCMVEEGIDGQCLDAAQQPLPNPGSIMSYCGGTNLAAGLGYQLRMTFLPRVAALMRQTAEEASCLAEPQQPVVILTSPHGQEEFDAEQQIEITWRSARVNAVTLEFTSDGGTSWNPIVANIPAADETYLWKLPALCSRGFLVRISDAMNTTVADTSILPLVVMQSDPSGLVAYYPFKGNSHDEAVCGLYPATGNAALSADRHGAVDRAYSFDGNSTLSAPGFISDFTSMSASCWFRTPTLSGVQTLVGQNWEEGATFSLYIWNGTFGGVFWTTSGAAPFQVWGPPVEPDRWYHAVVTYNGDSARVYINGVGAGEAAGGATLVTRVSPLYIGSRAAKEYLSGSVDDIRIYRKALSESEIKALYAESSSSVGVSNPDKLIGLFRIPAIIPGQPTVIRFGIPTARIVSLVLYNERGQPVQQLLHGHLPSGVHSITLDPNTLRSGVYFCTLEAGSVNATQKVLVVR